MDSEGLILTTHGRPIAHLLPIRPSCGDLIGSMKGEIIVDTQDGLLSTGERWTVES